MSKRSPTLLTGLARAKQLALLGMSERECLTRAIMYDKVGSITDDQEQELQLDLESYDKLPYL